MQSIIFFGSFQHHSVSILKKLHKNFEILGVVTTPPRPSGRHLELKPTEVSEYAKQQNLPLFELDSLKEIPNISQPDFVVVAGYGKLIPKIWLDFPKIMAINMHPSLLPDYAGAMPAEWAILNNETKTGVTLIKMSEKFDSGEIIAQEEMPIDPNDTRETLYTKLFDLGSDMLIQTLPKINQIALTPQTHSSKTARKLTRADGFIPWDEFNLEIRNSSLELSKKWRAFFSWPGVWSTNPDGKRVKLISINPIQTQEEGKN